MDPADTQYLKRNVGDALAKGMAQIVLLQPADPVQALGAWLVHHADFIDAQVTGDRTLASAHCCDHCLCRYANHMRAIAPTNSPVAGGKLSVGNTSPKVQSDWPKNSA